MTENLLNILYDPDLLPEALVESTFANIAKTVKSPSYYNCLQEEGLAKSSQKVG